MLTKKSSLETLSNEALCKLKPRWLTAAMNEGKELQDFLIDVPKKRAYTKNVRELKHHVSDAHR
jgi:hypothetical protein